MPCEFTDSITMEIIGQASSFPAALIDRVTMEVLGFFKFGTVDVDRLIMEVVGQIPVFANVDSIVIEVLGQADLCPSCS